MELFDRRPLALFYRAGPLPLTERDQRDDKNGEWQVEYQYHGFRELVFHYPVTP